jgi:hypothetical protein
VIRISECTETNVPNLEEETVMTGPKRLFASLLLLMMVALSLTAQTHRRRTRRTTHRTTTASKTPAVINSNAFLVSDGTPIVGVLNTPLSSRAARSGDTFTMTVTQPSEYRDAKIYGRISGVKRSGKLTGRSQLTLNFDRIRLPNGSSYRFAGLVESLRVPNGESINVDNEGTIQEKNQTTKTGTRAGIGTGAGALIGAIAGGGKGAAIGAIIGAGAGAGSVYAQGRTDLNLNAGTEIRLRATAPRVE